MKHSYYEASARQRLRFILDSGSFEEFLSPTERVQSPHLAALDLPAAFDDGIVVGRGKLCEKPVLAAAQEGGFMGGAVGEVHGAKLTGLLHRALHELPSAVILLLESGGVRLQEANAGLIAVSEVMRAVLSVRAAGVPVVAAIGAKYGCFGGTALIACCCDAIVMSEQGRLGLSGPEVIETAHGVEEFDARDRALVWRTTGGKHRYLLRDCQRFVADDPAEFLRALVELCGAREPLSLEALETEHELLERRLVAFDKADDGLAIWRALGIDDAATVPELESDEFRHLADHYRMSSAW